MSKDLISINSLDIELTYGVIRTFEKKSSAERFWPIMNVMINDVNAVYKKSMVGKKRHKYTEFMSCFINATFK